MSINKEILFGDKGREQLGIGINTVSNVARVTIGPRGRNVMIDNGIMPPSISNDGLEAIRTIILKNRLQNMGADLVRDVAIKTSDKARGARTASIILTQSIFNNGIKYMKKGVNSIAIKKGIEVATNDVIEELEKRAKKITSNEELKAVATISSESSEYGEIVAKAFDRVGKDGIITVEQSPSTNGIAIEDRDGMKLEKGWINPFMVNNPKRMEADYNNIAVLIIDRKMVQIKDFLPIQEKMYNAGINELFIVAEDVDGEALETFVGNNLRNGFRVVAIKSPGFGVEKKEILKDISILTGAKIISEEAGNPLYQAGMDSVGYAKNIVVGRNETRIVGNPETSEQVKERIEELKAQLPELKSNIDIKKMEERISRLSGGASVIKVGATTESAMKYLKDKISDSVNESRNALEEGYVCGGGAELFSIALKLQCPKGASDEVKIGYSIIKDSIIEPLKQIMINAGEDNYSKNMSKISSLLSKNKKAGYDAITNQVVEDMIEYGIIDSVKVIRIALKNASEAAAIALTVDAYIADDTSENNKN